MKFPFLIALLLLSVQAIARGECSGPMVVPNYYCMNPMGGYDIRLSVMEFQTCEDGKITDLDRNISLMRFSDSEIVSFPESDFAISFDSKRSYYDQDERVDDLTFIYPLSVSAIDGENTISMKFSNVLVPLSPGSFDKHMPGTFEVTDQTGAIIKKGDLSCSLFR